MSYELNSEDYQIGFQHLFGWADNPSAAYLKLRRRLIGYFQVRYPDSDEQVLTDRVIDRMLAKMSEGSAQIENYKGTLRYASAFARFVGLEYERQLRKEQYEPLTPDSVTTADFGSWEEEEQDRIRFAVFTLCLQKLKPGDRELLLNYYGARRGETKRLAFELGMSHGELRVKVFRLRQRLRQMIDQRYK